MNMKASVILCTYNRVVQLDMFLANLLEQRISKTEYELIIVNDGSTDETENVVHRYDNSLPIKLINLKKNIGKFDAVFIGIKAACTEFLLFTDDDCIADQNWISAMIQELYDYPIVAGRITTLQQPYLTLCRNISEFHAFMGTKSIDSIRFLAGANMGIHRDVLVSIGEIPETKFAFDMSIALHAIQKGFSIRYSPNPIVCHQPERKSLVALLKYEVARSMDTIQLRNQFRKLLRTPLVLQSSLLLFIFSPAIALIRSLQIFFKSPSIIWLYTFPVVLACKFAWCIGASRALKSLGK
jgi:O-antigen biosynthesis protein